MPRPCPPGLLIVFLAARAAVPLLYNPLGDRNGLLGVAVVWSVHLFPWLVLAVLVLTRRGGGDPGLSAAAGGGITV